MNHDIKLTDALLGATHKIESLSGIINVEIPSGAHAGDVLRVKGLGISSLQNKNLKGDILIKLNIQMPKKISKKSQELIEKLKEEGL